MNADASETGPAEAGPRAGFGTGAKASEGGLAEAEASEAGLAEAEAEAEAGLDAVALDPAMWWHDARRCQFLTKSELATYHHLHKAHRAIQSNRCRRVRASRHPDLTPKDLETMKAVNVKADMLIKKAAKRVLDGKDAEVTHARRRFESALADVSGAFDGVAGAAVSCTADLRTAFGLEQPSVA